MQLSESTMKTFTDVKTTAEVIKIPKLLVGIPTVKRNGEEYLSDTVRYLLDDLSGFREKFSEFLEINVLLYAGGMFIKQPRGGFNCLFFRCRC